MNADTNHLIVRRTGGFFDETIPIQEANARTGKSTEMAQHGIGIGRDGDPMYTLNTKQHAVAFNWNAQVDQMNFDSNTAPTPTRSQEPAVGPIDTLAIRGRGDGSNLEHRSDGTSNAILTPSGGRAGIGVGAIRTGMSVRRLTPVECERLQGFTDGHTSIPGKHRPRKAEDKAETIAYLVGGHGLTTEEAVALADCPDGPRYKAIGNSMAVPVMKWIGQRIAMVDAESPAELILS